jgi:glycosyltransferase involved in cell wall biosynthesis
MALRQNPSVVVLPTSLSPEKYFLTTTKNRNFLDLVWIGSSATKRYLTSALPFLEEIAESLPDLRLKIVADFDLTAEKLPIQSIAWSEEIEAEALASAHIGIAPMPDDAWTQGKCGLKTLQYMAAGLPVISSPSGVNKDIVEHGINGFLAQNPENWKTAIKHLAQNPDQRQRMGQAGRKTVLENYSLDATFTEMAKALGAIMDNPGKSTQ